MSLVIALKGIDSIVLAADTLATSDDADGMCRLKGRKLRIVNRGRWVLGFAGADEAPTLVEALDRRDFDFGEKGLTSVPSYARELWKEYQSRHLSGAMDFLLAGMDFSEPFLERWSFGVPKHGRAVSLIGPSICQRDHEAIGVCGHGGLYFAAEYHQEDMDTRQMISLAHFCVSEVAKQELLVGRPVDIAVVNRNGAVCRPESEFHGLKRRTESIAAGLRSVFRNRGPRVPRMLLPSVRKRGNGGGGSSSQVVLTAGEVTDRHVVDLLAPSPLNGKGLRLIVSCEGDSAAPLIGPEVLIDGRLHRPIALDDETLRAVRLPETSIACPSTRDLFERLRREISRAELDDKAASLATAFVISTWVADRLPFLPPLVISGPADGAQQLLRGLGWMCRRSLALGLLHSGVLPKMVSRLCPTLLIYGPELSQRASHFVRGSCVPGTALVSGDLITDAFCAKVIYAGESCDPGMFGRAVHVVVDPKVIPKPRPTSAEEQAIARELQARLLGYRLKACRRIVEPDLDTAALGPEARRVAGVLASAVDDCDVVAGLPLWLAGQDGWQQAEALVDRKGLVIEALLALCHEKRREIQIGEVCEYANAILKGRGEETLELTARKVGALLKTIGVQGSRKAAGVVISVSDPLLWRVHHLARTCHLEPCHLPHRCQACGFEFG